MSPVEVSASLQLDDPIRPQPRLGCPEDLDHPRILVSAGHAQDLVDQVVHRDMTRHRGQEVLAEPATRKTSSRSCFSRRS